jgi:hypothetical protein
MDITSPVTCMRESSGRGSGSRGLQRYGRRTREFAAVKIIATSGGGHIGGLDFSAVAEKLGAQRTLRKPFASRELRAAARQVVYGADA